MDFKRFFSSSIEARAILKNPHGRRMLGANMCIESHWPAALVDAVCAMPAHDKRELINAIPRQPKSAQHAIGFVAADLLPAIKPDDVAFTVLQDVAKIKLWTSDFYDIRPSFLANPALTPESISELWNMPDVTLTAKTALSANPNTPPRLLKDFMVDPAHQMNFVYCLAKYGDLTKTRVRDIVTAEVDFMHQEAIHARLISRSDLPPQIFLHLASHTGWGDYFKLARLPGFKDAVPTPTPDNLNTILTKNCVRLPPESSADTVAVAYDAVDIAPYRDLVVAVQNAKAVIACHPNASRQVMEAAIADESVRFLIGMPSLAESPHANWALPAICETQLSTGIISQIYKEARAIPGASPELLSWALEFSKQHSDSRVHSEEAVSIMMHPNFPWGKYSFEEVSSMANDKTAPALYVAAHLAGPPASHITNEMHADGFQPAAEIFSQNLSARQLHKLVSMTPGSAVLCAMHPNGVDIEVAADDPDVDMVYERGLRLSSFTLSGKSGASLAPSGALLEL